MKALALLNRAVTVFTGIVLGWAAYFLGHPLLSIYSNSDEVIAAGIVRLGIISTTYALCGCMDVMVGMIVSKLCGVFDKDVYDEKKKVSYENQ